MKTGGYFVISLDLELMWGMFDKVSIETYGARVKGVHTVVPELLHLFKEYDIAATWAAVGMLMADNAAALEAALPPPSERPIYIDVKYSSYHYFKHHVLGHPEVETYHFAPELINMIIATPRQELASHTFSHYYTLEGGENSEAVFTADARAMQAMTNRFGVQLRSIIFPRNQTSEVETRLGKMSGLQCYRGTEDHWLYKARPEAQQSNLIIRAIRLIDHYLNLSGHHTYQLAQKPEPHQLYNLPSSRFFRPFMPQLRFLETLRLRRIKNAMTHAAKTGEVFHLWWHPHNFGINRKENFKNLLELLEHYRWLKAEYGMESKNMAELTPTSAQSEVA